MTEGLVEVKLQGIFTERHSIYFKIRSLTPHSRRRDGEGARYIGSRRYTQIII